jgi:signal peptide peptidase SppA
VLSQPWAIRPEMAAIIQDLLRLRSAGHKFTAEEIDARIGAGPAGRTPVRGGSQVAVIPIIGVISSRMELMEDVSSFGTSPDMIAGRLKAALADPAVSAIVLDIDSPGGTVFGQQELADQIRGARGNKLVVAVANAMAASAAYWLGSQAEQFVVTPSGQVGSIGVLAMHEDISKMLDDLGVKVSLVYAGKFKVEGNPFETLGAEAKASVQADVDAYYAAFTKAVAKGRNVPVDTVRSDFGQGRMLMAADAARLGMVDGVETMDSVLARLTSPKRQSGQAAASADYYRTRAAIAKAKGAVHGVYVE